jgi:hypothetical protein
MNSTLYPEHRSRRVHHVYPERFARRAQSRSPLAAPSPSPVSARSFFRQPSTPAPRIPVSRVPSAPCAFNFQLRAFCVPDSSAGSTFGSSVTLLFVALPYIWPASPLSSVFTHLHRGVGVLSCSRSSKLLAFRPATLLFSLTCRLFALSLQRFHVPFSLFSVTCRHFFADQGGGYPQNATTSASRYTESVAKTQPQKASYRACPSCPTFLPISRRWSRA